MPDGRIVRVALHPARHDHTYAKGKPVGYCGAAFGATPVVVRCWARFAAEGHCACPNFSPELARELVQSLFHATDDAPMVQPMDEDEQAARGAFIRGQQSYENAAVAVWKATLTALSREGNAAGCDRADSDAGDESPAGKKLGGGRRSRRVPRSTRNPQRTAPGAR